MFEFLKWVLSDFWRFAGFAIFLLLVGECITAVVTKICLTGISMAYAIIFKRPLDGAVHRLKD